MLQDIRELGLTGLEKTHKNQGSGFTEIVTNNFCRNMNKGCPKIYQTRHITYTNKESEIDVFSSGTHMQDCDTRNAARKARD